RVHRGVRTPCEPCDQSRCRRADVPHSRPPRPTVEGGDHPNWPGTRCRLLAHLVLLRSVCRGRCLWAVRRVSAATRRVRGSRNSRPCPLRADVPRGGRMNYVVKEIYYTLQGEGANTGRAAVFLRFAGCNLWSGRVEDRGKGPSCSSWCDTDFVGT